MRSFKRIIAVIVALALIIGINAGLKYMLCPYVTSDYEINCIEKGGLSQIIVGTSHGKSGIDPEVLIEKTGYPTFNICKGGEYPQDVLYLVKEAARKNDLKRVIYEVDPGYWEVKANQTEDFIMYYKAMPFSLVKVQYLADKMLAADYRTTLTPWYLFRKNIFNASDIIEMKKSDVYRNKEIAEDFYSEGQGYTKEGFYSINHMPADKETEDIPIIWSGAGARKESVKAVKKLISFCEKKGIELVFVMAPIPDVTYEKYSEGYEMAEAFVEEVISGSKVKLINYWNPEELKEKYTLDAFRDYDGHMYKETAKRFSEELVEKL